MLRIIFIFAFCCFAFQANAERVLIKVGAYDFPPFIEWKRGPQTGVLAEFIKLLNQVQKDYYFEIVETSPNRRYQDLYQNLYDVIFFENEQWGWDKSKVSITGQFHQGGEVFIAKKVKGRGRDYFDELKGKSIRGYLGYHYAFVNFTTDPLILKEWNIELTTSHEGNIQAVLDERTNLAIVTKEFLDIYLLKNPRHKKWLLVSPQMDQVYKHSAILRKNGKIGVEKLRQLINRVKRRMKFK